MTRLINKNINGQVQFKSSNISFFTHFPSLTINLHEFLLKGSAPFQNDSLLYAKNVAFGINLPSVFSKNIKIDAFYIDKGNINVLVDSNGNANYNVYKPTESNSKASDTTSTAIKIEALFFNNCNLVYNDQSIPFLLRTKNLNYRGTGNLSQAIFDLQSQLTVENIDLYYNHVPYLLNKKLNAKLVTKINTHSLELSFNENNLKINSLPIHFKGRFAFLKAGYDMSFKTSAKETDLQNIFSALPAEMTEKFSKTDIKGYAEISASLIGRYIASENVMPTATFNLKIRDGYLANPNVPVPISNLYLNLQTKLPDLNPDRLYINMDSLYFNMGKDYVASVFKLNGLKDAELSTKTRANIDLAKWAGAVNFEPLTLKGRFVLDLKADGKFSKKVVRSGIRKIDTVMATVPRFSLKSSLNGGYLKFAKLPEAIHQIHFDLEGVNEDGQYQHTQFSLKSIDVEWLKNYIKGYAKLQTKHNLLLDAGLKSAVNLADIKSVYPIKDLDLSGLLQVDLNSKGTYNKARKLFPVSQASIRLSNGRIKTAHFPEALEQIQIDAQLVNKDGTLRGSKLFIKPVSFSFASQPFSLKADVQNFENVRYDLRSKGSVDIGKMYQFFAVKGYQVKGSIYTDVHFKGLQSDAASGQYAKLSNNGTIRINQLNLHSDLFPKSFLIEKGRFSFANDRMNFDEFKARYGQSDFKLNGALSNFINFALSDKAVLAGNFQLESNLINADEFMVFAPETPSNTKAGAASGVIIIPANLNIGFNATAKNIVYNGLNVKDAKGNLQVDKGSLLLRETGFSIIDAPVSMDASYKYTSLKSADFAFHLKASDFDIAKAYKEIKLFREMASSASSVKGKVGLDYQLSGRLNASMFPVLPSIKGGGTLTLKQVSLMGFKMMNAVSKATNRDSLHNPNLKDVQIKSTINKNILTIEQTKMKIAGFRPRFEGQVSLDGKLNLSGRLGLPPFGIFGIPLSITGTQEKPVIKLKRNKSGKLEEEPDQEDDSQPAKAEQKKL